MLTATLSGLEELRAEWASGCDRLSKSIADACESAARTGRGIARNNAPHRTGRLDSSIRGELTSRGDLAAKAVLEAGAKYASFVADGTRPHAIRARRKSTLRFLSGGVHVFRRQVKHPGTRPNEF